MTSRTHVRGLTPYLIVRDAPSAIAFYTRVLGATERARYTEKNGRVGHAELSFGGFLVHVADEYPEYGMHGPKSVGGVAGGITLEVDDADAVVAAAAAAGARVLKPVQEEIHGDRAARIEDPWGHAWGLRSPGRRVTTEELVRAWREKAGGTAFVAPTVHEVGYYTLSVPDVARGRRFYGGVLGWEFGETSTGGGNTYAHVENVRLPLGLVGGARERSPWLYYRVDDLDAAVDRVRAYGGTAEPITESKSGRGAECRDDQGVPFSLWEPAPGF